VGAAIEDYGLIGDTQTAALVSRWGSLDWLCLPRFDSGACFASLLGTSEHGRWLLAPRDEFRSTRRSYRGDTLILETELETDAGSVRLIDFMPPRGLEPDVVRIVEGISGRSEMRLDLRVRFDYGSISPWVYRVDGAWHAIGGPDAVCLRTPVELRQADGSTVAEFTVDAGQRVPFVLTWYPSNEPVPEPIGAEEALAETEGWWSDWSAGCAYSGRWRDAVVRSLIVLKALTYAPTGGIVAAPTTSLPEWPGGMRNWDYRICWLRDATLTLIALLRSGYTEEARSWREWLLRSIAGDPADLQVMYGPAGERRLPELELDWLPGHEQSTPVRVGNAATAQLQLDVYGEVINCLFQTREHGLQAVEPAWDLQIQLLDYLESGWRQEDEGIWEVRGPRRHFTHSKLMSWVAFDRAVCSVERHGLDGPVERWKRLRAEIHDEVCRKGYEPELGAFVQSYGSREPDAALLMIPLVGFLPASDERVAGTVRLIQEQLGRDGFVQRYRGRPESDLDGVHGVDGLPLGEGAFLPCSFWLVDNLALLERYDEAEQLFERLLGIGNDLGLFAEEYHPFEQRLLGNFPQAFTHVGLVNTALGLAEHQPAVLAAGEPEAAS
jgi:GH15 family glucan-1,4-alpha-glucosidase